MVPASVGVLMVKSFHVGVGWAIFLLEFGIGADLDEGFWGPAAISDLVHICCSLMIGWAISCSFTDLDGIVPAAIVMSDGVTSSLCLLISDWSGKFSLACTSVFFIIRIGAGVDTPSDGRG